MSRLLHAALLLLVAMSPLFPLTSRAQSLSRPDPADVAAVVPPVIHDAPFARYRAFAEQEVASWREMNDTIGRIGGWRVYAREANESRADGSTARPPAATPLPDDANHPGGHAGHGAH